jgi:DNA-binding PadR family transcriptional regulator
MVENLAEGRIPAVGSPIGWELLGLLIERPSYGYELIQRFERIYEDVLALSSVARIYNGLEALSARGLIEEIPSEVAEPPMARQPKHHYRATATGLRAYEEWLIARAIEERRRSHLFARQLVMLEPEAALEVIARYEVECLEETGETAGADDEEQGRQERRNKPGGAGEGTVAERLAAEDQRLALGVRLSWFEYVRRELRALIEERARGT